MGLQGRVPTCAMWITTSTPINYTETVLTISSYGITVRIIRIKAVSEQASKQNQENRKEEEKRERGNTRAYILNLINVIRSGLRRALRSGCTASNHSCSQRSRNGLIE